MRLPTVAIGLLFLALSAQAVTVTQDRRVVSYEVNSTDISNPYYNYEIATPATGQGEFWQGREGSCTPGGENGCGRQESFAYGALDGGGMGFYAEGFARSWIDGPLYTETGRSIFDVTLRMDEDMQLSMSSELSGVSSTTRVSVEVFTGDTTWSGSRIYYRSGSSGADLFEYALLAGQEYRVRVSALPYNYDYGNYPELGYTVTGALTAAVPVPAAVWLFASALAALGWARRE